jgi:acetyltransferase-like isoleucine patch superfamily enzyme
MKISVIIVALLPASRFKNLLLRRLGWAVHPAAVIRPNLVIGVTKARLEARASIGSFNVIRNVSSLVLESGALLGQFNWVTGGSSGNLSKSSQLFLGKESAITSRHYIDVSGAVAVGAFSTVAGERSIILTHQIDYRDSRQTLAAVTIGQYALVSSNVKIVPGASVPDFSVVAMGSVVTPGLTETSVSMQAYRLNRVAAVYRVNNSNGWRVRSRLLVSVHSTKEVFASCR